MDCQIKALLYIFRDDALESPIPISLGPNKQIQITLDHIDEEMTSGSTQHDTIYKDVTAITSGINVFLMSDRVSDIRNEKYDILKPEISDRYQNNQNIFIFTAPEKNIEYTLSGNSRHFKLIDIHEATKYLKMSLCNVMTDESDSDYFVREDYCYFWKNDVLEFLYPGDSNVYDPGTCWASSCTKRTSILERMCDRYSPHCESTKPVCGGDGAYFASPDSKSGCRWDCCKNVVSSCRLEMENRDYNDYDSLDVCINKKADGKCDSKDGWESIRDWVMIYH